MTKNELLEENKKLQQEIRTMQRYVREVQDENKKLKEPKVTDACMKDELEDAKAIVATLSQVRSSLQDELKSLHQHLDDVTRDRNWLRMTLDRVKLELDMQHKALATLAVATGRIGKCDDVAQPMAAMNS